MKSGCVWAGRNAADAPMAGRHPHGEGARVPAPEGLGVNPGSATVSGSLAAVAKHRTLGGFQDRDSLSPSSRGCKSKCKVWAGLAPCAGCGPGFRWFSLALWHPCLVGLCPSPLVFVPVFKSSPFCSGSWSYWMRAHPEDPISKKVTF